MSKKIWIRVKDSQQIEFRLTLAYDVDKELGICIAKDDGYQCPYMFTDIATGMGYGNRYKTLKEAREQFAGDYGTECYRKLVHVRKMTSKYKQFVNEKTEYLKHWRVEDELS